MSEELEFSRKIYHARIGKGMTQEQLAEAVQVTPRWIQHLEKGDAFPGGRLLFRLVRLLDIDLRERDQSI